MKVVGLTGGISTGKSTVAKFFKELDVPIVDADQVARDIVRPGEPAFEAIVQTFGEGVLKEGELDRKALGALVFSNDEARARLNAITHPRIAIESQRQLKLASEGAEYVMYEAALLVENGLAKSFDALVVVSVTPAQQLARLMSRDGSNETSARERIASQMALEQKVKHADYLIDNSGSLDETEACVREVHALLRKKFAAS